MSPGLTNLPRLNGVPSNPPENQTPLRYELSQRDAAKGAIAENHRAACPAVGAGRADGPGFCLEHALWFADGC